MAQGVARPESPGRRSGLLKDQVHLVRRKDSSRFEIIPFEERLSFDKGLYVVIRACQMLVEKNEGIVLVGLAGPSGAGKTVFTDNLLHCMPDVAVISMDNYNDSSRLIDGNFDDPRLTDYDTLLQNINDLKDMKAVQVPIYDFKTSSRVGYRTLPAPSSRIVILEGIYALSEKLRTLLDLRVSVTGGVHFDLVKRVLRDVHRADNQPEAIIQQISETVYPMYKAFIEPNLQTAHIKIVNSFNPFSGFQNPTYILKSSKVIEKEEIRSVLHDAHEEVEEQTYDIYLLPPGEDSESCQSYMRMRNRDGQYNLMFEEWVNADPFIISPRITFEVSVRILGGLMALGYTIAAILKRSSLVFSDDRVIVKIDWLEQLNRRYVQVIGKDRAVVKQVAEELGLEGSYMPRTYIEQIQLEKLVNEVMALPEDLKTKFSLDQDFASNPKEAISRASADSTARRNKYFMNGVSQSYPNHQDKNLASFTGFDACNCVDRNCESNSPLSNQAITQLSDQMSSLNERMDEFTSKIEELNTRLSVKKPSPSKQDMFTQSETCGGSAPTTYFISSLSNGSLTSSSILPSSPSSPHLSKDSPLMEEIIRISKAQRQALQQLESLSGLVGERLKGVTRERKVRKMANVEPLSYGMVLTMALGGLTIFFYKGFWSRT